MNIEEDRTVLEIEEYDLLITRSGIHRRDVNDNHVADEKAKMKKSTSNLTGNLLLSWFVSLSCPLVSGERGFTSKCFQNPGSGLRNHARPA